MATVIKLRGRYGPAIRQDFEITAGDAIPVEVDVTDSSNQPVDLSLATQLRFVIRKLVGGEDLVIKSAQSGQIDGASGLMTVDLQTRDTFSILGANTLYAPTPFLHEAVADMGRGEVTVCRGRLNIWPTIGKTGVTTAATFTYYVDPIAGNDANDGRSAATAWKTTQRADPGTLILADGENVGYLFNGGWALYRKTPPMGQADFVLPSNIYTGPSDQY